MRIQMPEAGGPERRIGRQGKACIYANCRRTSAFTLIEVLIAMALFFVAVFAILDLTSQNIAAARLLQSSHVDASSLAAAMSLTNRLEDGPLPSEIMAQFGEQYPGYTCNGNITEIGSNGLFQVDFEIYGLKGKKVVASTMSIWLFRPDSGSAFRNKVRR